MARWRSGDAADCKSVYAGSIPARASTFPSDRCQRSRHHRRVIRAFRIRIRFPTRSDLPGPCACADATAPPLPRREPPPLWLYSPSSISGPASKDLRAAQQIAPARRNLYSGAFHTFPGPGSARISAQEWCRPAFPPIKQEHSRQSSGLRFTIGLRRRSLRPPSRHAFPNRFQAMERPGASGSPCGGGTWCRRWASI